MFNNFQNLIVVVIFSLKINFTVHLKPTGVEKNLPEIRRFLTRDFSDCIFKWITLQPEVPPTFEEVTSVLPTANVRSFVTYIFQTQKPFILSSDLHRKHERLLTYSPLKFTGCLIHSYFLSPHLNFKKASEQLAMDITARLRKSAEWPQIFMFVTAYKISNTKARTKFYTIKLSNTFVRGLILDVNLKYKKIARVCLYCPPSLVLTYLSTKSKLQTDNRLLWSYHMLTSVPQLYGAFVLTSMSEEMVSSHLLFCDFMAPTRPKYAPEDASMCSHHILSEKFNYTYDPRSSSAGQFGNKFFVEVQMIVSEQNRIYLNQQRSMEWISYGTRFSKFQFVSFQRPPSGNVLTKPFGWIVWTSLFCGAGVLTIVTLLFGSKDEVGQGDSGTSVILSILATMLEQEVAKKFSRRILYGSWVLPVLWHLWVFMMIIVVNAYTGLLFALLTDGETLSWPASLKELATDHDYCVISSDKMQILLRNEGTIQISSGVRKHLISVNDKNKFEYLEQLNRSLKFHPKSGDVFGIEKNIVGENEASDETTAGFKIGEDMCQKFALLEQDPREDGMFINFLLKNVATSAMVKVLGYLRMVPVVTPRNFFHQRFLTGMGLLEAGGFLQAFERHIKILSVCSKIHLYQVYKENGTGRLVDDPWDPACAHQVSRGMMSDQVDLKRDQGEVAQPIRLRQLRRILEAYLIGLGVSLATFLIEIVRLKVCGSLGSFCFSCGQSKSLQSSFIQVVAAPTSSRVYF